MTNDLQGSSHHLKVVGGAYGKRKGFIYEREPWKSRNTRVVPVDNYAIFYIPDKTKKLVTVIRVMYSGRDVDKQLDEFTKL